MSPSTSARVSWVGSSLSLSLLRRVGVHEYTSLGVGVVRSLDAHACGFVFRGGASFFRGFWLWCMGVRVQVLGFFSAFLGFCGSVGCGCSCSALGACRVHMHVFGRSWARMLRQVLVFILGCSGCAWLELRVRSECARCSRGPEARGTRDRRLDSMASCMCGVHSSGSGRTGQDTLLLKVHAQAGVGCSRQQVVDQIRVFSRFSMRLFLKKIKYIYSGSRSASLRSLAHWVRGAVHICEAGHRH
jgi:hypothetical protein